MLTTPQLCAYLSLPSLRLLQGPQDIRSSSPDAMAHVLGGVGFRLAL
jgi:hypothetical protein